MKTFRASLSPEDQSQFQSYSTAALMIADLQLFIQDAQQPNIGKDFLSKMSSISESWQPYFDILSILVSAHPEYCAFFWGAIKFVFLVSLKDTLLRECESIHLMDISRLVAIISPSSKRFLISLVRCQGVFMLKLST